MVLSADFFERILKTLKTDASSSDKRAAKRIGIRAQVRITRFNGKIPEPAERVWTRDISESGIGILCPKTMKIGQYFVLELPREEDEPVRIVCQAKRRQVIEKELCVIGAAFQSPLDSTTAANTVTNVAEAAKDTAEPPKDAADEAETIQRIKSAILS